MESESKFLSKEEVVRVAFDVAKELHKDQKRRNGEPYFDAHVQPVADIVASEWFSLIPFSAQKQWNDLKTYVIAATLLHDTIEDCFPTRADGLDFLRKRRFPPLVIDMVLDVTKFPGESYFDFTMRVHDSGNIGSKAIKLADLQHNMSDLKEGTQLDKYRLAHYVISYFNRNGNN
jgi:(p)ppGpp synthase/HD superfamily hydrolase